MVAKLGIFVDLSHSIKVVNRGRTDGLYFYQNDKNLTISDPHNKLSEETQKEKLEWFLKEEGIKDYILE